MKKQILNIGKALNKVEQKLINGGSGGGCQGNQSNCRLNPTEDSQKCCSGLYCKKISGNILGLCVKKKGDPTPF